MLIGTYALWFYGNMLNIIIIIQTEYETINTKYSKQDL